MSHPTRIRRPPLCLRLASHELLATGLSTTAPYTYGHAIDDLRSTISETTAGSDGFNLGYTDPFNPGYDRGSSDLDIRQRFVLAPIHRTPWFSKGMSLKGEVPGNWMATGIYTGRSGTPFTYYDSTYNPGDFYNIARYVPSSPIGNWKYTKSKGLVPGAVNQHYLAPSLPNREENRKRRYRRLVELGLPGSRAGAKFNRWSGCVEP